MIDMDIQVRSIQANGSTVEDAVEAGLAQLQIGRDQVEIEVVEEGSRGVLGIGARDAVVRLTFREEEPMPLPPTAAEHVEPEPVPPAEEEPDSEAEQEATLNLARDVLVELLENMQIEAEVQGRIAEPRFPGDSATLVLDLHGDDLGFLIGRKGETLAAIQHLVRLMVNKVVQRRVHLLVDIEGYKVRRESALKKLALRIADQAARRGRRIALEPMSAYERRIIHVTLRNHPAVSTESVGEGTRRKVTICPKP
jgi:spoIIIJ-associated protein